MAGDNLSGQAELDLRIELGTTFLSSQQVPQLAVGSVLPLDKLTAEPVDVYASDALVGRGELLTIDGKFCVRMIELAARRHAAAA